MEGSVLTITMTESRIKKVDQQKINELISIIYNKFGVDYMGIKNDKSLPQIIISSNKTSKLIEAMKYFNKVIKEL